MARKQNTILKKFIKTENDSSLLFDEKIAIQLSLDIVAYGEELKKFSIALEEFSPFTELGKCYHESLPENYNNV